MTEDFKIIVPYKLDILEVTGNRFGRDVTKFINNAQDVIETTFLGEYNVFPWQGNPPYSRENLKKNPLSTKSDTALTIYLDNSNLLKPLFVYENFAIISKGGTFSKLDIEPVHYYAYWVVIALIYNMGIEKLGNSSLDINTSFPSTLSQQIKAGALTHGIDITRGLLNNSEHNLKEFIKSIDSVLNDIKKYYQNIGDGVEITPEPAKAIAATVKLKEEIEEIEEIEEKEEIEENLNEQYLDEFLEKLVEANTKYALGISVDKVDEVKKYLFTWTQEDRSALINHSHAAHGDSSVISDIFEKQLISREGEEKGIELREKFRTHNNGKKSVSVTTGLPISTSAQADDNSDKFIVFLTQDAGTYEGEEFNLQPNIVKLINESQSIIEISLSPDSNFKLKVHITNDKQDKRPFILHDDIAFLSLDFSHTSNPYEQLDVYFSFVIIHIVIQYYLDTIDSKIIALPMFHGHFDVTKFNEAMNGGGLSYEPRSAIKELVENNVIEQEFEQSLFEISHAVSKALIKEDRVTKIDSGKFSVYDDSEKTKDVLGYKKYATAFASIITDKLTPLPLTIGIYGPWGRGKSVLMDLIKDEINDNNKKDSESVMTKSIEVNAWEFSKTKKIWAELYAEIIDQVVGRLEFSEKIQFRISYYINQVKWNPLKIMLSIVSIELIILFLFDFIFFHETYFDTLTFSFEHFSENLLDYAKEIIKVFAIIGIPIYGLLKLLFYLLTKMSKIIFKKFPKSINKFSVSDEKEVLSNIKNVQKALLETTKTRFIIFIDDIDRCPHDKILQVLESITLFLRMENFIFCLAIDHKVVRKAIGYRYKFMSNNNKNEDIGQSYLEKIIQLPFCLLPVSGERIKDLNKHLLEDLIEDTKDKEDMSNPGTTKRTNANPSYSKDTTPIVDGSNKRSSSDDKKKDEGKDENNKELNTEVLRARIKKIEYSTIVGILDTPHLYISPRLFKRFINIYLIARHLYIKDKEERGETNILTPSDLCRWLFISIKFPKESKALLDWFESKNWDDPFKSNNKLFSENGVFQTESHNRRHDASKFYENMNSEFDGIEISVLDSFGNLLSNLNLDFDVVKKTKYISNCFQLYLD